MSASETAALAATALAALRAENQALKIRLAEVEDLNRAIYAGEVDGLIVMSASETAALAALRAENQALKIRMAEAEDLNRAIYAGEVDGLIVASPKGHQVFSLQHEEWSYRLLAEEMNQGTALLAEDGTVLWANRRLAEILRLPLEHLIGIVFDLFLTQKETAVYAEWRAALGQRRQEQEFIGIAADGTTRPLYLMSTPLPSESGAAATLIVTDLTEQHESEALRRTGAELKAANTALRHARLAAMNLMEDAITARNQIQVINLQLRQEIADRQQAEAALRTSQERLSLGISVAGLALAEIDYHTGLNHLTVEAAQLFGLGDAPTVVPRATVHATFHPEDRPELMKCIAECLDPEGSGWFAMDHRVVWPDGQVRWLRVRKQVFFEGEGPVRWPVRAMLAAFDVTVEKNAAEVVRQSEEFKRAVLDAVSSHVAVIDHAGQIIAVNESWRQFALENGPAPGQPALHTEVGANYLAICRTACGASADGALEVYDGIRAVLAGTSDAFNYEYPCHSPDRQRWFILTATPLKEGNGGAVISHTDVTVTRLLAENLRASEQRWRALAEAMPNLVWTCTPEGQCDYLSPQWIAYTGIAEAEQLGQGWIAQVHPDDHEPLGAIWQRSAETGARFDIEFRIRRADGQWRWFLAQAVPVRDAQGRIIKWYGANSDIEEIKRVQAELRVRTDRYELVMAGAQDGIWDWDIPHHRVHFSPRWKAMRGYAEDEISDTEENWASGIHPDDAPRVFARVEDHFAGRTLVFAEEYRIRRKDGAWRWVLDRGLVQRDAAGQAIRMAGSESDITDRKQAEEQLRTTFQVFDTLLASLYAGILLVSNEGQVEFANQAFCDLFDLPEPPDRLRGLTSGEILQKIQKAYAAPAEARARIQAIVAQGQPVKGEELSMQGGRLYVRDFIPILVDGQIHGRLWHHVDITRRREAETALRENEQRLALAFEVSHTFAFEWEPATDRVLRSASCADILGLSDEEARFDTGQTYFQRVHPDDRQRFASILSALKPDAACYHTQYRLIRGSGAEVILAESAQGFFDAQGQLQRLIGATTDITEQERAAQALHQTELRFRQMAEAMGDVFWLSSPDWQTILYISPAFERIWGRSCEELYASSLIWLEAILPEDAPEVLSQLESLRTGGHYSVEFRIKRPDGSVRWINDRGYASCDDNGQIILTSGVAADITDRKQMEQALRHSETRFRTLFEASGEALVLVGECGFLDCNEAAVRMFGCSSRDELLGQHPAQFSPPTQPDGGDSRVLAEEKNAAALRDGNARFEWQHIRHDGSEFPAEVLLTRIDLQGHSVLQATVRDITERHAMLEALAQAKDAAERANQAKSLFLANMSHEIRTPMNAIIGMTELGLATDPDERQRNYLSKIRSASDALLHIIDDILDFSKIEAGKLDLMEEPFTLAAVFDGLISLLTRKAQSKGLELTIAVNPDLAKRTFVGDSLRLGQVLINLTNNAIKFSEHGEVVLSVDEEGMENDQAILHFTVRDEGIGIAAADQPRLFQAFSQADASTTRTYGGTGLGLAISRRLVELMGGWIWVDSTPGQGSTFHFTARFAPGDPATLQVHDRRRMDRAALTQLCGAEILVVEDAELNQEVMCALLEQAGLRVRLATNGEEALRAVAAALPDGVLMDCQMPVMDGYEATRRLRAQERCRDLPIIALTANAMAGDRELCLAAGMNDFVPKPVDFRELSAVLVQWIRPRSRAGFGPLAAETAPDSLALTLSPSELTITHIFLMSVFG